MSKNVELQLRTHAHPSPPMPQQQQKVHPACSGAEDHLRLRVLKTNVGLFSDDWDFPTCYPDGSLTRRKPAYVFS
jgi:hypothetical protein